MLVCLLVGKWEFDVCGKVFTIVPPQRTLEQSLSDALLDNLYGVPQGLDHGLTLQSFDSQGVRLSGHDDERHNGGLRAGSLEAVVQPREGLHEHVDTLIPVLVTASGEEVKGVVQIKVIVAIKVTPDEVVDLVL